QVVDRAVGGELQGGEPLADVQTHHEAVVDHRFEDRAPVIHVVIAGQTVDVRELGQRDRLRTFGGDALDLGDGLDGIPARHDRQWQEGAQVRTSQALDWAVDRSPAHWV